MQGCWRLHQDTLSAAQMQLHVYETLKYLMITEMCTLSSNNCSYLTGKAVNTTKDNNVVAEREKKYLSAVYNILQVRKKVLHTVAKCNRLGVYHFKRLAVMVHIQ